mmetsp:Transcript_40750/g.59551  ORF Transcript_40750/g.59551 Transcript_40750/m.59551 type:complete len:204 (-) Transcript_40750:95-706(-)
MMQRKQRLKTMETLRRCMMIGMVTVYKKDTRMIFLKVIRRKVQCQVLVDITAEILDLRLRVGITKDPTRMTISTEVHTIIGIMIHIIIDVMSIQMSAVMMWGMAVQMITQVILQIRTNTNIARTNHTVMSKMIISGITRMKILMDTHNRHLRDKDKTWSTMAVTVKGNPMITQCRINPMYNPVVTMGTMLLPDQCINMQNKCA